MKVQIGFHEVVVLVVEEAASITEAAWRLCGTNRKGEGEEEGGKSVPNPPSLCHLSLSRGAKIQREREKGR